MDLEIHRYSHVDFSNPNFVTYAESFGAKGYNIQAADDFLPMLKKALSNHTVSVIACPVDCSENTLLTDKLGLLTQFDAKK